MNHARTIALHRIDIPSPCTASWDLMQGDDRVRHCGSCNKDVFNLSAMAEDEAADLLADNADGHLCVRFYRRADGTVLTSDCGARAASTRRQAWSRMAGATALALSAAACTPGAKPTRVTDPAAQPVLVSIVAEQRPTMGDVAPAATVMMGMPVMPVAPPVQVEPVAPPVPVQVEAVATMGAPPVPQAEPDAPVVPAVPATENLEQ